MKLKTLIITLIICLFTQQALALEADQYRIWEKKEGLKDSTQQMNVIINGLLNDFLARFINVKTTRDKPQACDQIAFRFLRYVRPHFFLDRMKSAMDEDPNIDLYPSELDLLNDYNSSIYRGFRWPFVMPVAQTVLVNGVYLGTDKIDHFFSSGRRFYQVYRDARKDGLDHQNAIYKALDFGLSIMEEKGVLGYWSSGAFSYADIEANYQGMMLGICLCDEEKPVIKYNEQTKKWDVINKIDWRQFINPLWDEAYNNSFYFDYRFNGVKEVLYERYCALGLTYHAQKIWQSYDKQVKSDEHIEYLQKLLKDKKIPDPKPQSLHEVCRYPDGVMEGVPFWK